MYLNRPETQLGPRPSLNQLHLEQKRHLVSNADLLSPSDGVLPQLYTMRYGTETPSLSWDDGRK